MNTENILKLAETIEKSETYDQTRFAHICGTPACIAGHAALLAEPDGQMVAATERCGPHFKFSDGNIGYISQIAQTWLGLGDWSADELFQGWPFGEDKEVTAAQAAQVLRHLAETGEVDWDIFDND